MNTSGPARQWPALRLHEYVEQIIDAAPAAPAILGTTPQDHPLSPGDYAQLERRANMLAHRLLAHGAGPGARVGVLLERSAMLPLAFLAVLKAGACYVPLPADLPPARLASMARQAGVRVLIALDDIAMAPELLAALHDSSHAKSDTVPDGAAAAAAAAAAGMVLRPQDGLDGDASRPCVAGAPDDLAAILFTSGSTGQPKGVPLRHDACLNMALGHIEMQGITAHDRVLLSSAPGFILGLRELCIPMLAGAAYVGVTRALLDQPLQLLAHMEQHAVSVALLTPSYLRLFDGAVPRGLRCIMTAGERPNADDARHYGARLDYWNMHGATEVCGTICLQKVDPAEEGPIASGYPFVNMTVRLLDANGEEVGAGEIGEIHVMGTGVAPGYLDQPELTAAAFVTTRYGRAYRTHDLGRWRADGRLDTLGRANDVIKVSGQSVSLGEIERTLVRHEGVRRAFVLQHEGRLAAFVESDSADTVNLSQAHWRTFLGLSLPSYMLPAHVQALRSLPVNSAGKADRMALLALAAERTAGSAGEAPAGELEQRIAGVWQQVLAVSAVGRHDHFFALGGTSLLAIDVCQRLQALGQPVLTRTLLAAPTVAGLAQAMLGSAAEADIAGDLAIDPVDGGLATIGQQDFWVAAQIGQADQGQGTIARVLQAGGVAPSAAAWRDAWSTLTARHPALRASFAADDSGQLHWHSLESVAPDFSQQRCASIQQAGTLIEQHAVRPFMLTQAPLARAGLVQPEGQAPLFWFVLHHAVADGLSARRLQEELYAVLRGEALAPAIDGMALASRDEQAYLASAHAARDRDWWQAELDALAAHDHGAAFAGPPSELARTDGAPEPAAVLTEKLDGATVAALARLAQSHQAGLHGLLLALLAAEARRRGAARQLLIGSAVSLRPAGADSALGHFVNLVPLALDAAPGQTFGDSVRSAQGSLAATIAHAAYPASLVYREFRQRHPHARPLGRSSLFEIALTANPSRRCQQDGAALTLAPLRLQQERWHAQAGLDLSFSHEPLDDGEGSVELALVWNRAAYTQAGAQAWLSALAGWARWLAENPARATQCLPALLPQEARQLAQWEQGPAIARPAKRADQLVHAIAQATPALPAIVAADGSLTTYAQLDAAAERIAQALQGAGVVRNEAVGVLADCTVNLPAAILGIWKAGAVYLPLALEQPAHRLAHMLRDAGASVLLAPDGHTVPAALAQCARLILRPESLPPEYTVTPVAPSNPLPLDVHRDPAYIIYTSGTTGMPKGVTIRHDSLVNAILMTGEALGGMLPGDRVALVATPGFDASLWELGLGLLHGLALVPIAHALRDDPWALKRRYRELGVSVAFHAPSYLRVSKDTPFDGLRVLVTGGEAPSLDDVRHYGANSALYNAYGPSETSIIVSMQRILPGHTGALPIGRPLANQHITLRRADGERVPPGVPGELWLGGAGVADGYRNNRELSARAFVDTAEGRFYRSGDLGRWNGAGQIELAGRIDHQIKLHGQRVELGEIEQAIAAHPAVREAVVLVFAAANQTQALRAFACLHAGAAAPSQEQWRAHLADRLPFHMLPSAVHLRAAMPVNSNGKIDRAALLATDTASTAATPPRAGLETVIAALWRELLDCPVGREDNFFALGGNSLLAVTMVHRLEQAQQLQVAARDLFAAPTLAGFAARVASLSQKLQTQAQPQLQPLADSDLASCGQREFWLAEMAGLDTRAFNMSLQRRIDGDVDHGTARWRDAWSALVAHNEALRTSFVQDADGHLRRQVSETVEQALEMASFDTEDELQAHIRARQTAPLAMGAAPLWRAGLASLRGGACWFWLALHHAVGDGRSLGILQNQLDTLLQGVPLARPQASFSRSVAREQAYLASADYKADGAYWKTMLSNQPAQAFEDWPLAQSRSSGHDTVRSGHRFQARLDGAATEALKALARSHQASLHAVVLALLALEAGRRGQRSAFLLGTAASTREAAFESDLPGYYVNMLPLPFSLDAGASFGTLLRATQEYLGAALRHARYPFSHIYSEFWEAHPQHRHAARFPLFDMAVSENPELGQRAAAPAGVTYEPASWSHAQDVVLTHELLAGGGMQWQWLVNAGVYAKADAQAWLEALLGWAAWLAGDAARAAQPLPALLPAEQAQLAQWERGPVIARPALRFHELVEQFAERAPASLAIVDTPQAIDYASLDASANRIANALLAQGCARGQSVAVLTDCTTSLPAAILGIWKAGAVYLPLALGQPAQRLAYMARDAGAEVLLVLDGQSVPPVLNEAFCSVLRPELLDAPPSRPRVPGTARDAAYTIYTSGTTGMPKGVTIRHDSLVNAILMTGEAVGGMLPGDRVALVATPGFDASLWELGLGLLHGLALAPIAHALRDDPWALKRRYRELGVSVAFHAPSYLRVSKDTPFDGLRVLITGGEAPSLDDVRHYGASSALYNAYGPTETCIIVSMQRILPGHTGALPVGRPLANQYITLRRADGERVPPGVPGELWLGGVGVADGYLNNPDMSARSFVDTAEGRFYRSGDLGRWNGAGQIELAGRIDHQIKLHGQRVELGEIEQAIAAHPAVREAVVLVFAAANQTQALCAFACLHAGAAAPSQEQWRAHLADRLPFHMLPSAVHLRAAMPVNINGKIDRAELLASIPAETQPAGSAPQGALETAIAALWSELLRQPASRDINRDISREDNFFALGGNSLLAVTMAHRLSQALAIPVPARELFAAPELAAFAARVEQLRTSAASLDLPAPSELATVGQREFWIAETAGLDTRSFNMPLHRQLSGVPDLARWNAAWAALVQRHDALRSGFAEDADCQLRRYVVDHVAQALEYIEVDTPAAALAHIRQRQGAPLFMAEAPVWRAGLVCIDQGATWLFWLAMHHAVGDGQTLGILQNELSALLQERALPALEAHFGHSAALEHTYLASPACRADEAYWRATLAQLPASAFDEWSLDHPRNFSLDAGCHRFQSRLDPATGHALKALARRHQASLHAVMLTLLALEVRRRAARADFVLGTTASTREAAFEADVAGYYVNMLPLACSLPDGASFGTLLRATRDGLREALQHARYPFARMYHDFWQAHPKHRHPARYPLFDLAVSENPEIRTDNATVQPLQRYATAGEGVDYELTSWSPGQDMVLTHECLADGGVLLQWQVNAMLYSRQGTQPWLASICAWAGWLAEHPAHAEAPLPALLPAEQALLQSWEYGAVAARPAMRFERWFETLLDQGGNEQASRPAVLGVDGNHLSYAALEAQANGIANQLLAAGAQPGERIGVLTGRSPQLPAALLGLWKAGATYLPLAAELPPERLAFMARDAGITRLLVLDGHTIPPDLPASLEPVRPAGGYDSRRPHIQSDAPAYIIYTSGSTGAPKGAVIGHAALINTVFGCAERLGISRDDRTLCFSAPSFDVSLSDMCMPLAFGAALCPLPAAMLDTPHQVARLLTDLHITVADLTPTYLRLFDGQPLASLRALVTGGEAPFPRDVALYRERLAYFNAYGPTENTITSSMAQLTGANSAWLSCGAPLPNTSAHVCGPSGQPLPPGVAGELWLGGAGLALSYLNRPELSDATFIDTPQGRRYRSGDLARWNAPGELEILGRSDDQVKLNGIRIELGEIEHALGSHPAIAQAACLVERDGSRHVLWAFARLQDGAALPAEAQWRAFLAQQLPAYMLPSALLAVPAIPVNAAGKVDKAALRALLPARSHASGRELPQGEAETSVAHVWRTLLNQETVYRNDNFFALGGHSLLAISVAQQLEREFGHAISPRELFAAPTLGELAARLRQLQAAEHAAGAPAVVAPSDRASEGQREFWVAQQAGLDTRGFNIALTLAVHGNHGTEDDWRAAWYSLTLRHAALRSSFREDEQGVLRCAVSDTVQGALECTSHPDLDAARAYILARQGEAFDMGQAPLWRAGLAQADGQPVFWLSLHHAVGDGMSLGLLAGQLRALLAGRQLPPLPQPAAAAENGSGSEASYLASAACEADARYWQQQLEQCNRDGGAFEEWPLDFARPLARTATQSRGGHALRVQIGAGDAARLRSFARSQGASLHALMLTLMGIEVQRRSGRTRFVLGTASSTRDSARDASQVGYFVNMLPLACAITRDTTPEQALAAMQHALAQGLRHGRYPFARMYQQLRRTQAQAPHPARYPLFDMVVTENPPVTDHEGDDSDAPRFDSLYRSHGAASHYELRQQAPAQDIVLIHEGQADGSLSLLLYVNAALYQRSTAQHWLDAIAGWAGWLADPARPAGSARPALLAAEEHLLAQWQNGATLPHPAPRLEQRVAHWASTTPDQPALVFEHGVLSYAELERQAGALAQALLAAGVTAEDTVAVLCDHSHALPLAFLAILKAGGCYLPLVASLPEERLAVMADDARVRVLLVLDGLPVPPALAAYPQLRPESAPASEHAALTLATPAGSADALAYMIYTSGSTGKPKGVMLPHRGLANLAYGAAAALGIRADDRILLLSSPAFDAWVSDVAMAWAAGAALVPVLRADIQDVAGMHARMARLGVTAATMSPSYLRLFEQQPFPGLRILMTVGEQPHLADARHYATQLAYFNGYGPTETSAAASFARVAPDAAALHAGRPQVNSAIYLRNSDGEPVPPGSIGQLWIGGMGLARGYVNQPDQTAQRFVQTAWGRNYNSGDLARWSADGQLQVLGRSDRQVKLRGQRIELDEIEAQLCAWPGVSQALAMVAGATPALWAFVAMADTRQVDWRTYLAASLPSYMIPQAVIRVDAMPMTESGKIDQAALLALTRMQGTGASGDGRSAPHAGVEQRIARLWAEQLGLESTASVARDDSFFDLGGNSLQVIAVISKVRREFDCSINDLYEHPTLAGFAARCRPRSGHLQATLDEALQHWRTYQHGLPAYEAQREAALAQEAQAYAARNSSLLACDLAQRTPYRHVLLTGATGYLGAYLLRELLLEPARRVSVLVRAANDADAHCRLYDVLAHYFGPPGAALMMGHAGLGVHAGDLRRDGFGLSVAARASLADGLDAIFHSAANVSHFGHYEEFHAANVASTERLLQLARTAAAHFHLMSTISVCGAPPEDGFRLFTEDHQAPQADANYYVRTKQEAEQLVVDARAWLPNASIHRVGNLVFPAGAGARQRNIEHNAFFRHVGAMLHLGAVPDDVHVWMCHVDLVARGVLLLAESAQLRHSTHHLENARRDTLADIMALGGLPASDFGQFIGHLQQAVDDPHAATALAETMENMGLYRGRSPQARGRRLEVATDRTQALLSRLGLVWPSLPGDGAHAMLKAAALVFPSNRNAEVEPESSC